MHPASQDRLWIVVIHFLQAYRHGYVFIGAPTNLHMITTEVFHPLLLAITVVFGVSFWISAVVFVAPTSGRVDWQDSTHTS